MSNPHSPGTLAGVACVLETSARKPGNVHRFRDFSDTHYLDFLLSALAIGAALDDARGDGVGAAVRAAVRATWTLVGTNTNLGMILLMAPLAAVPEGEPLGAGVERVLETTTVADAKRVFEAVRLAKPGGLGTAPEQDISAEPTVTLREVMRLAAARDSIARQYANAFEDVFARAVPCLTEALAGGHPLETAIILTYFNLLSAMPDTLIARKRGWDEAVTASRLAEGVLKGGWPDGKVGVRLSEEFDGWLRAEGHTRNPGTTADLVAAALFVGLREGIIGLPLDKAGWGGHTAIA